MLLSPSTRICTFAATSNKILRLSSRSLPRTRTITRMSSSIQTSGIRVKEFGGPEVLKIDPNISLPPLANNEVLIRVHYSGVNPVETYIRSGAYPTLPSLPFTPGGDASGVVQAVGTAVSKVAQGDRVFCLKSKTGAYAEHTVCAETNVFKLHDKLSFAQGACLGVPFFTAFRALVLKGNLKAGESVLIHGASGAVGTAAVQIAKHLGADFVAGTAGTQEGLDLVKKCGASAVFCHRDAEYEQAMKEASGGGFDVILENLANVNLDRDMNMIKKGSRILIVGNRGEIKINPRLLMGPEAAIQGVALMPSSDDELKLMGDRILQGIQEGAYVPHVDREYKLEEAAKAHVDIIESKGARGNLVLKVRD